MQSGDLHNTLSDRLELESQSFCLNFTVFNYYHVMYLYFYTSNSLNLCSFKKLSQ